MKGLSTVVSELILIVLTIAVAGLLYAWTVALVQTVLQRGALGIMPKVIDAMWFLGNYTNGQAYPIIVVSFQSAGPVTVTGVQVIYEDKVICDYPGFLPSSSQLEEGIRVAGFVGLRAKNYDPPVSYSDLGCHDVPWPGLILFQVGRGGPVEVTCLQLNEWGGVVSSDGTKASGWVTIAPISVSTLQIGDAVETYVTGTSTIIQFQRMTSLSISPGYVGSTPLPSLYLFKEVRVGRGYWSLILWCPGVNPAVYDQVKVRVFFEGLGVEVEVPI